MVWNTACKIREETQQETGWTSPSPPSSRRWHARSWWTMQPRRPDLGSVLGAVPGSILNGPQGTQRDLLSLGQSPDPRDIEPLVGAVASQRAQMLATLQIPECDGPVLPATGQSASIGTHLERLHRPLMRFSLPHALPAVHLPPAQPAVAASTDKPLPTGSPGHGRDYPRMPHKGAIPCPPGRVALPALHLPHEELPALSAAATRG